jgi:hypothetical protein
LVGADLPQATELIEWSLELYIPFIMFFLQKYKQRDF